MYLISVLPRGSTRVYPVATTLPFLYIFEADNNFSYFGLSTFNACNKSSLEHARSIRIVILRVLGRYPSIPFLKFTRLVTGYTLSLSITTKTKYQCLKKVLIALKSLLSSAFIYDFVSNLSKLLSLTV